jgi:ribosome recycling factor
MKEFEERMRKSIEALAKEFQTIRTGRANPSILDRIQANYYGTLTPIKNMSNISIIDGRTLAIIPFDRAALKEIEKAIQESDLGLSPTNDGSKLLIIIPELTQERRKELAKLVHKESEEMKVSIRNIRREALDRNKKDDGATEDDKRKYQDDVQKLTDKYISEIDKIAKAKEEEIMKI